MIFKRKKSYPVIVAEAREQAKKYGFIIIVYQQGKVYNWCTKRQYARLLETSKKPIIKLLICMPNGVVVQ